MSRAAFLQRLAELEEETGRRLITLGDSIALTQEGRALLHGAAALDPSHVEPRGRWRSPVDGRIDNPAG